MGFFQKIGEWVSRKGDGHVNGYVPAEETGMNEEVQQREVLDPFGNGDSEYGGRQVYQSVQDLEQEAAAQAAMQQQMQQMPPQQMAQPMQQMQQMAQPMQQMPPQQMAQPMQQMPPQQMAQPMQQVQPQQMAQPMQQVQPQQEQQPAGNVVNFPGVQTGFEGQNYGHVEYVVLLHSRNECKDIIAYMKLNASVFLNMEFIASDAERQRCVDMLSGAAYTVGCALNKISPRGIYLISSPSVRVVLDPAMQKLTSAGEAQNFVRQRYENENNGYYQQNAEEMPQRPAGSFTTRFQAQGSQRTPSSFGSVMAGNATGMYHPVSGAGHYSAPQQ